VYIIKEERQAFYTSGVTRGKITHVGLVGTQPLIVKSKSKSRIVFKVEFKTSSKHGRIVFVLQFFFALECQI